jgi:hypothetical protein
LVEPGAHFFVDGRVVEELEVDKPAEVLAVADGERDLAAASAPPVAAGGLDEEVSDELAEGWSGLRVAVALTVSWLAVASKRRSWPWSCLHPLVSQLAQSSSTR